MYDTRIRLLLMDQKQHRPVVVVLVETDHSEFVHKNEQAQSRNGAMEIKNGAKKIYINKMSNIFQSAVDFAWPEYLKSSAKNAKKNEIVNRNSIIAYPLTMSKARCNRYMLVI